MEKNKIFIQYLRNLIFIIYIKNNNLIINLNNMSFKTKNRKKKCVDTRVTIDAKHNEQVKSFKEKKKQLPLKKKELGKLKIEYDPFDYLDFSAVNRPDASFELRQKDKNINDML